MSASAAKRLRRDLAEARNQGGAREGGLEVLVPGVPKVLKVLVLAVLTVLAVLEVPQVLSAQQTETSRDGVITGQVVDATTGRPVSAVFVTLTGTGLPQPSAGRGAPTTAATAPRVLTGSDGRFVFPNLQAGRFTLTATKNGFAEGASGRRRPGGTSQPVTLTDAQRSSNVVVRVWKQAALGGTVTDEAGEPIVGLQVRLVAHTLAGGRRRYNAIGGTVTDDRGVYRFSNLAPGEYRVVASPPIVSIGMSAMNDAVRGRAGGSDSGAELAATLAAGRGVQVGDAMMSVGRGFATPPPPVNGRVQVYPPTYHPSAASPAQAPSITVAAGEERSGIDIHLQPVATARISGTVTGPAGPGAMAVVRLLPIAGDEVDYGGFSPLTSADNAGAFVFPAVVPGQYVLRTGTRQGADAFWAEMPLTVSGDQEGIAVLTRPAITVGGTIEYDGAAARPERTQIPVVLESIDGQPALFPPSNNVTTATGFTLKGYAAGRYLVRVSASPSGWMFKSAMLNGVDVSETPMDLSRDVSDLVITFTDRWTGISGVVQGEGSAGATVIVFPSDAQAWSQYGSNPRRLKSARADVQGRFGISSLPPGDYFAAAIPDEQSADWRDPKNLDAFARIATRVSIGDGEHRTIDLRLREVRQ